jgi:hypothetical protein
VLEKEHSGAFKLSKLLPENQQQIQHSRSLIIPDNIEITTQQPPYNEDLKQILNKTDQPHTSKETVKKGVNHIMANPVPLLITRTPYSAATPLSCLLQKSSNTSA